MTDMRELTTAEIEAMTAAKPEIRALTTDELSMVSGATLIEFLGLIAIMRSLLE